MENSKKVSLVGTVLFTVCSILVLDSFVAPAIIGVSSITVWIISAIIFFIPYGLLSAELGSTYPDDGGIVSWVGPGFRRIPQRPRRLDVLGQRGVLDARRFHCVLRLAESRPVPRDEYHRSGDYRRCDVLGHRIHRRERH